MAKSKSAKQRQAKQRAQQRRTEHHDAKTRERDHEHLPKTGTAEDDAYLLRRHREDLVGFGEFRRSKGPWPTVVAVGVGVLFALGILAWVLFFL